MVEVSAKAGVAGNKFTAAMLSAANFAARDESAPMKFPGLFSFLDMRAVRRCRRA
jgi:hypothetical protein